MRELVVFAAAFLLFPLVARLEPGTPSEARRRALALLSFERRWGLDVEQALHEWLLSRPGWFHLGEGVYLVSHVSALVGVMLWAAARRPAHYRSLRNCFLVAHVITIAMYLRWPTAPPRLLDPQSDATSASGALADLQYEFAALPSGHVVFAVVVARGLAVSSSRPWRVAGAIYPVFVTWLVVATGHHLVIDAVVGVLVVLVALAVVRAAAAVWGATARPMRTAARPLESNERTSVG